jgi:carbon monoxide dehydrogenase subunit G
MELASSRTVPASVEATWAALNDPETLKACIPGCETIERTSETEFRVTMTARVGPVAAKFTGRIMLADLDPPRSYRMSFEGQGGAAGFARGEAHVALAPDGEGTRIEYRATAQVGGKLAQIGSRLVDGAAAKVADDFFARFAARLGGGAAEVSPRAIPPERAATALRSMWLRLALAILILACMAIYWLTRPG